MTVGETVFVTGFPGFIAGRLIERLIRDAARFFLLVQPPLVARAQRELEQLVLRAKTEPEFFVVEGDIAEENLGLAPEDLAAVRSETTRIFHLAALYDLAVPRDLAMRINLEGTQNLNRLARSLPNLRRYNYISTCYVAGKRKGVILEAELEHHAGFRNYYEESKYLAELEVDRLKGELPVTIYRPAVVCGDSQTGETAKYDGVYYLIHYLLRMPRFVSRLNIGNEKVALNLVPVDFVVDAIATLASESRAAGKTVQIADPSPLTTRQLCDELARIIYGRESLVTAPATLVNLFLSSPPSPAITGLPHHGVPYFFIRQTYDSTVARELLAAQGLRCPTFTSYAPKIVEFA